MSFTRYRRALLTFNAVLVGLAASGHAGMTIGVYATARNTAPLPLGDDRNHVHVQAGDVISMIVYADVTQVGAVGNPPAGTGWPVFSAAAGGLVSSTGGILANFTRAGNHLAAGSANGVASSAGIARDLDGDGDTELYGTDPFNPSSGYVLYRHSSSGSAAGPNSTTADGSVGGVANVYEPGFEPTPIPGGFRYILSKQVDATVINADAVSTQINWVFRQAVFENARGLGFENSREDRNPTSGGLIQVEYNGGALVSLFATGEDVTLIGIPEPSAVALLAAAVGFGGLAHRRRRA
jgi:hypothetical protein